MSAPEACFWSGGNSGGNSGTGTLATGKSPSVLAALAAGSLGSPLLEISDQISNPQPITVTAMMPSAKGHWRSPEERFLEERFPGERPRAGKSSRGGRELRREGSGT